MGVDTEISSLAILEAELETRNMAKNVIYVVSMATILISKVTKSRREL